MLHLLKTVLSGIETVNGSNAIGRISRSDFDQGHRVLSNSSVKFSGQII
jgi:hypothetical protein